MAYVDFVDDKPVISDDGDVVINNTRENLMAVRDGVVMGKFLDWNMTPTVGGGSAEEPDSIEWRSGQGSGTDRVRATITWGTSGGADGNPTTIVWAFSVNGSVYDTMGTQTITYDVNANITWITWA